MKYTEDTLQFWTSPLSNTEEQRVENTVSMIKNAVTGYNLIKRKIIWGADEEDRLRPLEKENSL